MARKSSCQLSTCNSRFVFPHFNLFYIRGCALSDNVIIYMHLFHTCLVRLHTYCMYIKHVFITPVWYTGLTKRSMCIHLSLLSDVYSKILKATQTHHLLPDLCWLLSENIQYIGPLWAQHNGGKSSVKTNAWSVELNWIESTVAARGSWAPSILLVSFCSLHSNKEKKKEKMIQANTFVHSCYITYTSA